MITTLRPDGTANSPVNWTRTGGSTIHGVLADNSDATYMQDVSGSPANPLDLDFTTAAALGTITSLTIRLRAKLHGGFGTYGDLYDALDVHLFQASASATEGNPGLVTGPADPTEAIANYTSGANTTKPTGGAWTQAAVDEVRLRIRDTNYSSDFLIYEAYIDVDHTPAGASFIAAPSKRLRQAVQRSAVR